MKFDDGVGSEEERKSRLSGLPQAAQAEIHNNEAATSRPLFPLKPVRQVDIVREPVEICG